MYFDRHYISSPMTHLPVTHLYGYFGERYFLSLLVLGLLTFWQLATLWHLPNFCTSRATKAVNQWSQNLKIQLFTHVKRFICHTKCVYGGRILKRVNFCGSYFTRVFWKPCMLWYVSNNYFLTAVTFWQMGFFLSSFRTGKTFSYMSCFNISCVLSNQIFVILKVVMFWQLLIFNIVDFSLCTVVADTF